MELVLRKQQNLKTGIHSIEDLRNFKDIEEQLTDAQIIGVNYYEDLNERIPRKEIEKHESLLKKMLAKVDASARTNYCWILPPRVSR